MANLIEIEVAYAGKERQVIVPLSVEAGTTAVQAILASGILKQFPEIEAFEGRLGIFGKPIPSEFVLKPGDRVEIYRSLQRDPKESRRLRAKAAIRLKKQKNQKS